MLMLLYAHLPSQHIASTSKTSLIYHVFVLVTCLTAVVRMVYACFTSYFWKAWQAIAHRDLKLDFPSIKANARQCYICEHEGFDIEEELAFLIQEFSGTDVQLRDHILQDSTPEDSFQRQPSQQGHEPQELPLPVVEPLRICKRKSSVELLVTHFETVVYSFLLCHCYLWFMSLDRKPKPEPSIIAQGPFLQSPIDNSTPATYPYK